MELRDYQRTAIDELRAAINESGSALLCMPTGSGKTVVAAELARLASINGKRTMLIVHRRELVDQAFNTLKLASPNQQIGIVAAGKLGLTMPWALFQIGMVQTLARRAVRPPDLVIVDEAHHARAATWAKVLERWPGAARVGLTATPQRLDGKGLGMHFKRLVMGPSIKQLIARKSLAPFRVLRLPEGHGINLKGVRKDRHGEWRASDVSERLTGKVIASTVNSYRRYADGQPAIFFGIHRQHSAQVAESLRAAGYRAEHVGGDDPPARRAKVMNALRTGGIDVVCNCDLISEGFDAPNCAVVMIGKPTRSITSWLQMCGRAGRYVDGKVAIVLDLVGASHVLGLPDETRVWTLDDGEIEERRESLPALLKTCPQCGTVHRPGACPACGYLVRMEDVEEIVVDLEIATAKAAKPARRHGRVTRQVLNSQLRRARISPNPAEELRRIAKQNGYEDGWVGFTLRRWGV